MNLQTIPVGSISQGENVRTDMTKESLTPLIKSIKDKGILQPILVSKEGNLYKIIAGHRRYNSAVHAGLKEVPALITKIEEAKRVEYQITENLQRADLNPIDEALAYKELAETFKPEDIVVITGKSLYRIKKILSLLNLSKEMKEMVKKKEISEGHALVISKLKSTKSQNQLATAVKRKKMSPEQTERHLEDFSQRLENVLFDKKECKACAFNGSRINDLFDGENVKGKCLNPTCFNLKVKKFRESQKKKILEKFKNKKDHVVIVLEKEPKYGSKDYEQLKSLTEFGGWQSQDFDKTILKNECMATCPTFLHVVGPHGKITACCANEACFKRNMARSKGMKAKAEAIKESGGKGKVEPEDELNLIAKQKAAFAMKRKESRVDFFMREFYLSRLNQKASKLQVLRLAVDKLLSAENGSQKTISEYLGIKGDQQNYMVRDCLGKLTAMKEETLQNILTKIVIGRLAEYGTADLTEFGKEVKVNISKEFIITKEYLNKFSKQGLMKLAKELKMKVDLNFGKQKKTEMIEILIKLGLKGKVPKEMLK